MERRPTRRSELTERQREVLALIAAGKTNGEIADALGISLDGAKYHVREIMGRLGVDSREEAAAWWRAKGRPRLPVPSLRRAFVGPLWAWLGGGAAALAVAAGAIVIAAVTGGHGQAADSRTALDGTPAGVPWTLSTAGPATAGFAPTAIATVADPPPPAKDPAWVLANGTPVDFDVCTTITDWTHPTLDEVLDAPGSAGLRTRWQAPTDADLDALLYGLFLARVTYVTAPNANSGRIEWVNLSGINHQGPGPTKRISRCPEGQLPFGADTQELWLADYSAVAARRIGGQLVMEVNEARTTFEVIDFAAAGPASSGKGESLSYDEVDVVDSAGQLRYQALGENRAIQYSASGDLEVATLPLGQTVHLHVARQGAYSVYGNPEAGQSAVDSDLAVRGTGASSERHFAVHAKVPRWTPSASISLSPGDYDIRIEGGTGRYILLPDGAPLPTDP